MRPPSRAFSLVEMLVVLAVLTLLVALLLPALQAGRKAAQATLCRTKLAQIGQATHNYAIDNRGFFPPANAGGISWPSVHNLGPGSIYHTYLPLTTRPDGPQMCPTYQNDGIHPRTQIVGSTVQQSSYTYNIHLGWENAPGQWDYYPARRVQTFKNPQGNAYIVDGLYRSPVKTWYGSTAAAMDYLESGTATNYALMNRHPGQSNHFLFLDNHVQAIPGSRFDHNATIFDLWIIQ